MSTVDQLTRDSGAIDRKKRIGMLTFRQSLLANWPEYLIEGSLTGAFMFWICLAVTLLESPQSPAFGYIPDARARRAVLAVAIGLIVTLLIQSPWGKRSGAHLNPAVTVAFLRLRRVQPWNAFFYVLAQFAGACVGVRCVLAIAGSTFREPPILYAVTVPGRGVLAALLAETTISLLLMAAILACVRSIQLAPFTGPVVGALIAAFILFEASISGASMNPARTLASALAGHRWEHVWIYLCGPSFGMWIAAELQLRYWPNPSARSAMNCAKLLHPRSARCIHCGYQPGFECSE